MRSSHSLDRLDTAFDDDRLVADAGLLLPATLAHHLGLQELVDRASRPRRRAGPGERRRQAPHPRRCRPSPAATASTTRTPCGPVGRSGSSASPSRRRPPSARSCAASAGATSASSTGSAGSSSAGPGRRVRDRARTAHDRSRLDDLRDVRPRQGGRPPPRPHRRARLSPPPRDRRRDGRRAHGPPAGGAGEHRPGRRPLPARDDRPGPPGRCQRTAHGPRRQWLLRPRRRPRLPNDGRPFQHHHPHEPRPAPRDRGDRGERLTPIPYWIDGGADVAETRYTPFREEKDAVPVRLIVRRVRPTPGSQLALLTLYDYHPFITDREGTTGDSKPITAGTPRWRTRSAISSTGWASITSPRAGSPRTAPGWPSRSSPTTSPAGRAGSRWARGSSRPRPSAGASSASLGGSPARPAGKGSICRPAGRGRPGSRPR